MRSSIQRYVATHDMFNVTDIYPVSRAEVTAEYQSIEQELSKLESELKEHFPLPDNSGSAEEGEGLKELDKFAIEMHQFYKESSTEFKRIQMLSKKMEESYDQTVRFYGEDPKKMPPDEFFGIFKEFTTNWEKCSADSREHRLRQERLEKQKKRELERRKRAYSNAGKAKGADGEDDKAILHSLLDKLKKDTLDVKARRRSQRQRQRSTSVSTTLQQSYSTQNVDPIYQRANKMLRSIQAEASSSLLDAPSTTTSTLVDFNHSVSNRMILPDGGRRRMSASVLHVSPGFRPIFADKDTTDSPMSATAPSSTLLIPNVQDSTSSLRSRRHARPLSAIIIPESTTSSQSLTTAPATTRHVRVRKTSTRPVFDHTLRVRARRMSTK